MDSSLSDTAPDLDLSSANTHMLNVFLDLCRIPSPSYNEGKVADYVRGYLDSLNVEWSEDDAGEKIPAGCGNITVRVPASMDANGMPVSGTRIFLCSHLDTVTLEDSIDPVVEAGRVTNSLPTILGGDNKAAVAVMLEAIRLATLNSITTAGFEVVFTPCEETGLEGAKCYDTSQLTAEYGYVYDHAREIGGVVGSAPTQISWTASFLGQSAHSGIAPEKGRSAIRAAAEAISGIPHGRISTNTTANVGLISGGTAGNVVPAACEVKGEMRSLDAAELTDIERTTFDLLAKVAGAHDIDLELDARTEYRGYNFRESSPVVKTAFAALSASGYSPQLVPCGGGSDANIFNAAGLPCANLCNGMQDIHTPDESISVEDLNAMLLVTCNLLTSVT